MGIEHRPLLAIIGRHPARAAPRVWLATPSATANGVVSVDLMALEEELKSEIERLRAENEALKKPARGHVYLKVSEKGGLSAYGMDVFQSPSIVSSGRSS